MVQVDLITGFLGAGKTTFLRRYAAYLAGQGERVCILENDFGAVNVDAMLVQDLLELGCEIETISGGCDCDTHQRRMRTKLISMAMRGFTRVLVEPSGIFDVDEFFDVLRDDPLDRWYQLGNVIAIVDALLPEQLSPQADYVLASECANAGLVLLSRSQLAKPGQCEAAVAHLKRALTACKCSRVFQPEEILAKDWAALTEADMARIARCGMRQASCEKLHFEEHEAFSSAYFLELGLPRARLCGGKRPVGGAERYRRRPDGKPAGTGPAGAHRDWRGAGQGSDRAEIAKLNFLQRTGKESGERICFFAVPGV